jgi:integrase
MPLKPDEVKAAIAESIDNRKFTRLRDGNSLYLMTRNGRGYWLFMYKDAGSLRSKMLGTAAKLSPLAARKAREAFNVKRLAAKETGQPVEPVSLANYRQARIKAAAGAEKLFGEVVTEYLDGVAPSWRGGYDGLEAKAYRRTLTRHALASIPVDDVNTSDVESHLANFKPVTAEKTRLRIQTILDHAKFKGYRDGENPARLKGHFEHSAARKVAPKVEAHPAMASADVPALMDELATMDDPTSRMLAFLILTATRTDETRLARWREIDFKKKLWIIAAERTKERLEHRVPLSDAALKIIGKPGKPDEFVFPSPSKGALYPIWDNGANHLMKRLLRDGKIKPVDGGRCPVPHGFRATFSGDWAAQNGYPLELREMALAHSVGDAVIKAYNRPLPELYKIRIPMMNAWSKFVTG